MLSGRQMLTSMAAFIAAALHSRTAARMRSRTSITFFSRASLKQIATNIQLEVTKWKSERVERYRPIGCVLVGICSCESGRCVRVDMYVPVERCLD